MPNIYILSDEVGFLKACATYVQAKKEQRWWMDEGIETTITQLGYTNDRHSVADLINNLANHELPNKNTMGPAWEHNEKLMFEKKGKDE